MATGHEVAERGVAEHEAAGHEAAAAGGDRKLTLSLPAPVIRQLRQRMAAEDTTVRALVLEALSRAGYRVPPAEIRDRRRGTRLPRATAVRA
jgi:hypothetical protein